MNTSMTAKKNCGPVSLKRQGASRPSLLHVQIDSGAHSASFKITVTFLGVKIVELRTSHSTSS